MKEQDLVSYVDVIKIITVFLKRHLKHKSQFVHFLKWSSRELLEGGTLGTPLDTSSTVFCT